MTAAAPAARYLTTTLATLIAAAIITAPVTCLSYWLITGHVEANAPDGVTVMWTTYGPFDGWFDPWFWATLLATAVTLPKALYRVHKRRGRPEPGGILAGFGLQGDARMLGIVHDWLSEHAALLRQAAPGTPAVELFPACARCGDPVTGYEHDLDGRTVLRFQPCGCRVMVNRPVEEQAYT